MSVELKYKSGDILYCTLFKVTVVLIERYDKPKQHLEPTWKTCIYNSSEIIIARESELIPIQ